MKKVKDIPGQMHIQDFLQDISFTKARIKKIVIEKDKRLAMYEKVTSDEIDWR